MDQKTNTELQDDGIQDARRHRRSHLSVGHIELSDKTQHTIFRSGISLSQQ